MHSIVVVNKRHFNIQNCSHGNLAVFAPNNKNHLFHSLTCHTCSTILSAIILSLKNTMRLIVVSKQDWNKRHDPVLMLDKGLENSQAFFENGRVFKAGPNPYSDLCLHTEANHCIDTREFAEHISRTDSVLIVAEPF